MLSNEAYAELRDEVEMDLVDAYVGGTLTPLERRHFDQRYLVTRERKECVKAAYLSRVYRERIARPAVRMTSRAKFVFFPRKSMIPEKPGRTRPHRHARRFSQKLAPRHEGSLRSIRATLHPVRRIPPFPLGVSYRPRAAFAHSAFGRVGGTGYGSAVIPELVCLRRLDR